MSGKVEWLPVADLLDADPEPVPWLCEPLLARGAVTILCGPFGVGKSLFAIAAGSAIAHGAQQLGGMRVRPRARSSSSTPRTADEFCINARTWPSSPGRACGSASAAASTFAPPKAAASCAQRYKLGTRRTTIKIALAAKPRAGVLTPRITLRGRAKGQKPLRVDLVVYRK